jgi:diguanylate cyclase (GGDEF)-like protein
VIGDRVLEMIVQAIRAHIHETDVVGRWGGEEFGVVLLKTEVAQARRVADRIRQTLLVTSLGQKAGQAIPPPTISQGIAVFPAHAPDAAALIDLADAALYRAKARGRDQVCVTGERE